MHKSQKVLISRSSLFLCCRFVFIAMLAIGLLLYLLTPNSFAAGVLISSVTVGNEWGDNVSITINANEQAKFFGYSYLPTQQPLQWLSVNTFTIPTNGDYYAWAKTESGVTDTYPFHVSKVDNVPPEVSDVVYDKSWTSSLTIVINGTDMAPSSGIVSYALSESDKDAGVWKEANSFMLRKNGVYFAWVKDAAGHVCAVPKRVVITNIDTEAPTKPQIKKKPDMIWAREPNVEVSVIPGTDAVSGVFATEYRLEGDSDWRAYTAPFIVNANTTVYARTIDHAGNISIQTEQIRIDSQVDRPPQILFDYAGDWTNHNAVISIVPGEDALSGVAGTKYKIGDGPWQDYATPFEVQETALITAVTFDVAGNEALVVRRAQVDKEIPSLAVIQKLPDGEWVNEDVSLTITSGTDNNSGVQFFDYSLNREEWQRCTINPFHLKIDTTTLVTVRTVDNANNESRATCKVNIDKTPPVPPKIIKSETAEWSTQPLVVSIDFGSDDASGIARREYRINDGEWIEYTEAITFKENAVTTLTARSVDAAGNESRVSGVIKVDTQEPDAPVVTKSINVEWAAQPNKITIATGGDNLSGIASTEYSLGAAPWKKYTEPFEVSSSQSLSVRVYDVAGNYSEYNTTIYVDMDQPTAPVLIKQPNSEWNRTSPVIVITPGKDTTSGIAATEYQIRKLDRETAIYTDPDTGEKTTYFVSDADGAPIHKEADAVSEWAACGESITLNESCILYVKSTDRAGNSNSAAITVMVDKIAPLIPTISAY